MIGESLHPVRDEQLIMNIARGDRDALAEVYLQHKGAVYAFALSMLRQAQAAEDVMQETFLQLWNAASTYVPRGQSALPWLLGITKNTALKHLRASQRSGIAYMVAKRVNHLQAQKAAAGAWKERRARINTISPGVIVTPLAYDEFSASGDGYQRMIDASAAERTGTSDEIAEAAAFLLGEHAGFITGTDLLIDGGVIASIRTGQYSLRG